MVNKQYERLKYEMTYSKGQVSKAGRALRKGVQGVDKAQAIMIVQDFRASHAYPLMLLKNHVWRTARKISPDVTIARRLKRLPTIINKLERPSLDGVTPNATEITRMQDIGGCRAIFEQKAQVNKFLESIQKSRAVHSIVKVDDYNQNPKKSGYRGIHLVYNCYQNSAAPSPWKGHKIEVQVRTRIQHAWSTAVELIDLFEKTDLKTGMSGHEEWRELFFCLSTILAARDGDSSYSDEHLLTTTDRLRELCVKLHFVQKLANYTMAQDSLADLDRKNGSYLIAINVLDDHFRLEVRWFSERDKEKAIAQYNQLELDLGVYQTVLVGAQGAGSLIQAYPNFFADSAFILQLLSEILTVPYGIPTKRLKSP